jgi:alkylation response protein AidB-like acyl-CoA dehydrogenase
MDLTHTPEQEAFREQARVWLRANAPRLDPPDTRAAFEDHRAWERALFDAGYAGLAWPVAYGGRALGIVEQAIFESEYLLAGAPERINVVGHKLMAPTLFAHGTDAQRQRWLAPMLRGDEIWSQGFSEPDAGSDLAGIRCRALLDGDDVVINGQKIWTSYGAFADWIFVLARSDPDAGRHRGLSFIAVDMRTEGVEARPITQLDGHGGFAEVFFTDARVPSANVIGSIGDGWSVAMTTLAAERDSPARPAARYRRDLRRLVTIARAVRRYNDPVLRDRVGALAARAESYRSLALQTLTLLQRGEALGSDASTTKLLWSELERDIFELTMELIGAHADTPGQLVEDVTAWQHDYWYARAATIYAGTSEIQRSIIAERILGLPR